MFPQPMKYPRKRALEGSSPQNTAHLRVVQVSGAPRPRRGQLVWLSISQTKIILALKGLCSLWDQREKY